MATADVTRGHTIAFVSAKGGSGKTVLSASLAVILGSVGVRVLIVDCDASTNGMTLLFLQRVLEARGEYAPGRELVGSFEADAALAPTAVEIAPAVSLIPATYVLRQTTDDPSLDSFAASLDHILGMSADGQYDIVLLDAQAGTDSFARLAVERADQVVIVSEYDPVSAEGNERLRRVFVDQLPPNDTWVLYNKVLPDFATSLGDFLLISRHLPPIQWDADVIRAFARRELAVDERGNAYTLALLAAVQTLLPKRYSSAIAEWLSSRESSLRKPIREGLIALDREVLRLERSIEETNYRLARRRRIATSYSLYAVGAGLAIAVALIVTTRGTTAGSSVRYATTAVTAVVGVVTAALVFLRISFRDRRFSEVELAATARALERQLREATQERERFKVLQSADLNALIADSSKVQSS
jgi:cellulose biosynthesis protein BcsQ